MVRCQDDPKLPEEDFSLAKLPWECLGQELSDRTPIHVLRTTQQRPFITRRSRRSKLRILAIFGDDTGLSFKAEREAIEKKLRPIAYVQFEGHNISPKMPDTNLKTQIKQAIEDPLGWDILFFAGHSDEGLGGELMLAPGYSALIAEFEQALKVARDRGLQFALFNSCRGCAIAEKLISYGLSHVVVMREQVVNEVAQVFFLEFADRLANLEDVQTAALGAVKALATRAQEHYQYPSAYLVPSVYAYSGVQPLKPPPLNWRVMFSWLRPSRREAIVLVTLALLSCQTAIQYPLIDGRQLVQVMLRGQHNSAASPPILLVKLDEASLNAAKIRDKDPIDRGYMARLVSQASRLQAPVIGIDYVFKDNDRPRQSELSQALKEATANSRVVLAAGADWGTAYKDVIDPALRIDGDIDVNLVSNLNKRYPVFLARTIGDLQYSTLQAALPFPQQILCQLNSSASGRCSLPAMAYQHPITALSAWVGQQWLNPWIDYSSPRDAAYETITSQQFLERSTPITQAVLLVPGEDFDKFTMPKVLLFQREEMTGKPPNMAGGEIHAYLLYNLIQDRLLLPIPDLWMIGLVGICSKLLLNWLQDLPRDRSVSKRGWFMLLGVLPAIAYLLSFLTYIWVGVVLPLVFPTLVYFSYLLPDQVQRYWNKAKQ
jgi:CHASE2 domain